MHTAGARDPAVGTPPATAYTLCFLTHGEQVLLLNRLKAPCMGNWNGVGGKLQPGETPLACALREVEEETDVAPDAYTVRATGRMRWTVDGEERGILHLYWMELGAPPVCKPYPLATREGILMFHALDWALSAQNAGVVSNIRVLLPALMTATERVEFHCEYDASGIMRFVNDYSEAMHPAILEAMISDNGKQHAGYGLDTHCSGAARMVRKLIEQPNADVHFIPGGTQTNIIACMLCLRSYECVIATQLGHVSTHETGAIEATGHKVFCVQCPDGKMRVSDIESALHENRSEHMVLPKMVYISNTTEVGTQYTKKELEELSAFCRSHGLYFFLDGARLASALTSPTNDLTLADIARLVDLFYMGATKIGGMFGEALIILNDALKPNARYLIKQRGALLAKGWLLGMQFEVLLKDNLYFELGAHANRMAGIVKAGLEKSGVKFAWDSDSNQLFPILSNAWLPLLNKEFETMLIEPLRDGTSIVRVCTAWSTKEEECHRFVEVLRGIMATTA